MLDDGETIFSAYITINEISKIVRTIVVLSYTSCNMILGKNDQKIKDTKIKVSKNQFSFVPERSTM